MKRFVLLAVCAMAMVGIAYAWQTVGASGPGLPLRLVGDFPLTGNATRFDYASLDSKRGILWVADMGDVLALDPVSHRLYAASESGVVSVYDVTGRRLHRTAQAFLHLNAHVVAVDPATNRVYFSLQNVGGKPVMRVMEPH